jgi:hypothetical protein
LPKLTRKIKSLIDIGYPGTAQITGSDLDNPWPIGVFSFAGAKDHYGHDEVSDILKTGGVYAPAFWLALDGFNKNVVGGTLPSTPTVNTFSGATASLEYNAGSPVIGYQTDNPKIPQRIRFQCDMNFTKAALGSFPSTGETAAEVDSDITILGLKLQTKDEFFFVAGADPYFTNVQPTPNPNNENAPYLSQDLRVFTVTPRINGAPIPGVPGFADDSGASAYNYIQSVIKHFNSTYGDPNGQDLFDVGNGALPGQAGAYTGDSSVTPSTKVGDQKYDNYNFALGQITRLAFFAGAPPARQKGFSR